MKTNTVSEWPIIGIVLLPFVYLAAVWSALPAEIATHFDLSGKPNDWMRKENAALVMGILSIGTYLLLRYLPQIDPKGSVQSDKFSRMRLLVSLVLSVTTAMLWYIATHPGETNRMGVLMPIFLGLVFVGLGNYMTTVRPNFFVGIRTPWTLSSEPVWRKTHRMGGRLMVAGGLLSILLALVLPISYATPVFIGITVIVCLLPVVYSYIWFQQEKRAHGTHG